jgi:hypothetical protein
VKRALLAAVVVALATAAPAAAMPKPLEANVSVSSPAEIFGNGVTVSVSAIADTTRVDPARLRVKVDFAPYEQVGPRREVRTGSGRYVQTIWTWKLRCLTVECVPVAPPSDVFRDFRFPPAQVHGVGVNGKSEYRAHAYFPQLEVLSAISPREKSYVLAHKHILWLYQLVPAAGDAYRVSPGLVFWLAVALAGLCGAAALFLAGRWAIRLRSPAEATPAFQGSYLERALALFFWANAHGDETLQRKALERVADELPLDVVDLSEIARELAWSPETPEGDEVEAISERAGVPVHPEERNGA